MTTNPTKQDIRVRAAVYDSAISTGLPPKVKHLAGVLSLDEASVRASFERLAAARVLVLQKDSREVLMANPFSAVPTSFAVILDGMLCYGNCIWDALGIPAMLGRDALIRSSCACCGDAMELSVSAGSLEPVDATIHFAVPVRRWWQDIVYT
ncbi:MAG TPA: organomercurial lyase [Anaerolineales bacterium]|nr:organomercurial lyase [Anaerolineales bacterium]